MYKYLEECKQKIELRLNEIIDNEIDLYKENPFTCDYLLELKRLSEGGKKVRGFLTKIGQLIASVDDETYIDIAVSIEIFQTSVLIHDDIIDCAQTRRGKETINGKYKGHIGISKAICVGDLGYFLAHKVLMKSNIHGVYKEKILEIFFETIYKTVLGEIVDNELTLLKFDDSKKINNNIIENFYLNKTAWYTIIGPLALGFCSVKIDTKLESDILNLGTYLGFAFQIKDDLLDLYAEEESLGKPKLGDIKEGKQTLLHHHAMQNASKADLLILEKYYGKKDIETNDLEEVLKIYEKLGSKNNAEMKVEEYTSKAIEIINNMNGVDIKVKNLLIELSNYLLQRTY